MVSRAPRPPGARCYTRAAMFANLVRLALARRSSPPGPRWARGSRAPRLEPAGGRRRRGRRGRRRPRLAVIAATFGLAWLARSPRARGRAAGHRGHRRLVAGEWRAMLANNFLWLPFERLVLRADPPPAPARPRAGDPRARLLLQPRHADAPRARARRGGRRRPSSCPACPRIVAPIEDFAAHLERIVREVTEASGQPRAILVCHSMGGLIARTYLSTHGAGRVAGLVTLGSPHHGSALARAGRRPERRGRCAAGARSCANSRAPKAKRGPGCATLSISTAHDNLVAPQESSRLHWARNVALHGVGHLAMLLDARVHRAVLDELARLGARPAR